MARLTDEERELVEHVRTFMAPGPWLTGLVAIIDRLDSEPPPTVRAEGRRLGEALLALLPPCPGATHSEAVSHCAECCFGSGYEMAGPEDQVVYDAAQFLLADPPDSLPEGEVVLDDGPLPSPVYLAARYSRRKELVGYAERLTALGCEVRARWLDGAHESDFDRSTTQGAEDMATFAAEDLADVLAARCVIAFTEEPRTTTTRGGRHVEYGTALARAQTDPGLEVIVVGPVENVFHALAPNFPTFDALIDRLVPVTEGGPEGEQCPLCKGNCCEEGCRPRCDMNPSTAGPNAHRQCRKCMGRGVVPVTKGGER